MKFRLTCSYGIIKFSKEQMLILQHDLPSRCRIVYRYHFIIAMVQGTVQAAKCIKYQYETMYWFGTNIVGYILYGKTLIEINMNMYDCLTSKMDQFGCLYS